MDVLDIYDSIPLKICHCKAGRRYFDSIRNMYVHITPEETVRQKTCQLLAGKLGVPLEAIRVEEHLCHYDVREKNGRIDIAICSLGSDGEKSPLAVVECKEERISVRAQQVLDQAADYAFHIKAPYNIVTNGVEMNYYHVDLDNKQTKPIDGLVTYKELMDGEIKVKEDHNEFKRLPYEEYYHIEKLIHYDWFDQKIGEDTDDCLIPTIINLDDCLYDTSHKMHCFATDKFRLIADLGIQYRNYNDASGGEFGTGDYRVIRLMEEKTKREFLVGFSIMTTGRMIKDPK